MKLVLAAAAATLAAAAGTAGAAGNGIVYTFMGKLSATPSNGDVSITVQAANPPALRAMLGQPLAQTFSYGSGTEFLQWTDGVPAVVQAGDLDAGDIVRVNVRAPRGSSLAQIEQTDATVVGDHGTGITKPDQPLFLFRGKVTAVGASSITIDARPGDRRARKLLEGQPRSQTFTVGADTIYLRWTGKVPAEISLADVKAGDPVAIRVRADKGSTLPQVEATPATKVVEHEPGA
jgi:FlaG/FlaF family flagellin (archaellin)